jgi:hypothetical protein
MSMTGLNPIAAFGLRASIVWMVIFASYKQSANYKRRRKGVAARNESSTTILAPAEQVLVITRVFDAPPALVFKLWTDSNL